MINIEKNYFILLFTFFILFSTAYSLEENYEWSFDSKGLLECIPTFKYTVWSKCEEEKQTRSVIDLNSCVQDKKETRTCNSKFDENENLFLNSKEINLISNENKIYSGILPKSDFGYIYHSNKELNDSNFILFDNEENIIYFGRLIDSEPNKYHYFINQISTDDFELLLNYGFLIDKDAQINEIKSRYVYSEFGFMIGVLFLFIIFLIIVFNIKRHNRKSSHFDQYKGKEEINKTIESKEINNIKEKSTLNELNEKHIEILIDYIKKNSFESKQIIAIKLKKVGWNEEEIKEAFRRILK